MILIFRRVLLQEEDTAASNSKDVNDHGDDDDEDFGECDEVFHDPLCEEEVSSIITIHTSFAVMIMSDLS